MTSAPVWISLAGALACFLLPGLADKAARRVSLATALLGLAASLWLFLRYPSLAGEPVQWEHSLPLLPALGLHWRTGADGISLSMMVLTGLSATTAVLFSWNIARRVREYHALALLLVAAVYGVFVSQDLLLLFLFYELAVIPKYFLIVIWGSTRKDYAAMKLALYSFAGGTLVLIGLLCAWAEAGGEAFGLRELQEHSFPIAFQKWAFPVAFLGFAVLAGIWPLHTWAPVGHVAAPTGASMLLAGVVMKLGAYGALRFPMALFPDGWEAWRIWVALLGAIGILYGALAALAQRDFKFVIGYSSISHMGFVLLGFATREEWGLSGAVLQMFSHGLLACLLFAVVGRMIHARTGTRDLSELGAWRLSRQLPLAMAAFVVGGLGAIGMPGLSGFVAELHVLVGTWKAFPLLLIPAVLGILVGAGYTLSAYQSAFAARQGPPRDGLPPLTLPEKAGALALMAATLLAGLFPGLLLDRILPAMDLWIPGR